MNRVITLLALVTLLVGFGPSCSPSAKTGNRIITVQSDDPGMNTAMQSARDRFSDFWRVVSSEGQRVGMAGDGAMVKAYFSDADKPESGEHMWVREVQFDGKMISGFLADTPEHVRSVRAGEKVSFVLAQLSDWFYIEDGKVVGAFTVNLLRSRMTEQERQEHDSHYPFRFE